MTKDQIIAQLAEIQHRWNFNPNVGARQAHDREAKIAFSTFQNLVRFAIQEGVPSIPFDPAGLNPLEHSVPIGNKPTFVYFAREVGSDVVKVGFSTRPYSRIKEVQTGNSRPLEMIAEVQADSAVEQRILSRLQGSKTRDRNKPHKGEWLNLPGVTPAMVRELIAEVLQG
jgi:hypothetical protein